MNEDWTGNQQISLSDNSHIMGKPIRVWGETHLALEIPRRSEWESAFNWLSKLRLERMAECHIIYERADDPVKQDKEAKC